MSNDYMMLVLESNTRSTWVLPKQEFLFTLLNASEFFFNSIIECLSIDDSHYSFELKKIIKLREVLGKN